MEFHLLKIAESSESIRTLYFRPPSIFTNAVIYQPEITSLIHDADHQERALFTVPKSGNSSIPERKQNQQQYKSTVASNIAMPPVAEEWNADKLCAVIEQLSAIYPVQGVAERVAQIRYKWGELNDNIMKYEEIVEEQRQQLAQLNMTIESRDFEDVQQDPKEVARLIEQTQQEVAKLERELEQKQTEISQLEGRLNSNIH